MTSCKWKQTRKKTQLVAEISMIGTAGISADELL